MTYGGTDYGYSEAGYGYGVNAFTGFDGLSIIPDTLGWWSVARRVLNRYNGPAIRLRRSSDSAERDFYGIGPQGEVSTADVRAWNGWNLLRRTEEFGDSYWVKSNINVSVDVDSWPLGSGTADQITPATNSDNIIYSGVVGQAGSATHAATIHVKKTSAWIVLMFWNGLANQGIRQWINCSTGTLGAGNIDTAGTLVSASVADLGTWFRVSLTGTFTGVFRYAIKVVDGDAAFNFTTVSSTPVVIAGAQLERASSFTTYEPRTTTGAGDSFLVTLYEQAENGRNLLRFSEEFDNAAWANSIAGTGVAPTVTPNAGVSPFGDLVADRIQFSLGGGTTTSDYSRRVQSTGTGVNTYTYSIYLRSFDGVSTYNMHLVDPFSQTRNIVVTGSWQRFEVSATPTVNPTIGLGLRGGQSLAHPNTADVLVCCAQLEVGTTATTYERRTTHGAGTRLNFTQSTTTLQPIICEQGVPVTENNRLAAKFVAADGRRMSIASSTAMFNALHTTGGTILLVHGTASTGSPRTVLANKNAGTRAGILLYRGSADSYGIDIGRQNVAGVATDGRTVTFATAAKAVTQSVSVLTIDPDNATAASRAQLWFNGALDAATNAETATPFVENAFGDMTLGANSGGGAAFTGPISEVALFSDLIGTTDRTAWQSRSGVFYGVAIS